METSHLETEPKTKAEAIAIIGGMMAECYPMGANDGEMPNLQQLMVDVENDKIEPEKAIARAMEIRNSKAEDH